MLLASLGLDSQISLTFLQIINVTIEYYLDKVGTVLFFFLWSAILFSKLVKRGPNFFINNHYYHFTLELFNLGNYL